MHFQRHGISFSLYHYQNFYYAPRQGHHSYHTSPRDSLHLDVIAEGVESAAQNKELLQMGCCQFQGYYLARPGTLADLQQFAS
ncbi:EAL domain-containing protein [Alkalimonas sp. NCh-2]|uniref:EAL domain-containing protein n=1 Tax=Alkalimonas sp. NCh-2 TaxID=3144846 RepID=UPI0031F6897E